MALCIFCLLPAFFSIHYLISLHAFCCPQDVIITPDAVRARMIAAVKTLRAEGSSGGIVWFAIAANNKVKGDKGVYNDDNVTKRVTPTTPIGKRPFYLWDLISVSPHEYAKAYTKRPQGGLDKWHGSSLAVRDFKGATFAAICSEDGMSPPVVPDHSNV